jgi:hypothetical protein
MLSSLIGPSYGVAIRVTTARPSTFADMRTMFAIYLIGIFGGIGYFVVIGLSHH